MEKVAELLTDYIVKRQAISKEDYEIYKYGFLTGMEMFICVATCYLVAIQMDMFGECTAFFLLFFALRSFVGGLHLNSFRACYCCSCIVVLSTLYAIKFCPMSLKMSLGVSIFEVILLRFLHPVENENRPVDEKERKVFSKRIKQTLVIVFVVIILFYVTQNNRYLATVSCTLCVIIASMFLGIMKNRIENRIQ